MFKAKSVYLERDVSLFAAELSCVDNDKSKPFLVQNLFIISRFP